jgi:hypothetical protein
MQLKVLQQLHMWQISGAVADGAADLHHAWQLPTGHSCSFGQLPTQYT